MPPSLAIPARERLKPFLDKLEEVLKARGRSTELLDQEETVRKIVEKIAKIEDFWRTKVGNTHTEAEEQALLAVLNDPNILPTGTAGELGPRDAIDPQIRDFEGKRAARKEAQDKVVEKKVEVGARRLD